MVVDEAAEDPNVSGGDIDQSAYGDRGGAQK
jgi:hypothetical protein